MISELPVEERRYSVKKMWKTNENKKNAFKIEEQRRPKS